MRRADEIGRAEQRRGLGRLLDEHIERGAADMAAVEPFLQRHLVDQATARAIDDAHALLGLGQRLGGEDVARLVGQRRVQRDEVGARQQLVERHLLYTHLHRPLGGEERIEGHHLHLEPARAVGDDRADIARADQAERLGGQLDAHEAVLLPLARLGRGVGLGQLAGEREHQRDGMFGGGDRIAERRVHHHHALGGCRGDIDIVDADAGAADDLQIGRMVEDLFGDLGRAADGEAVILADDRLQLVGGLAGDLVDLDAALAEDLRGLGVHFVADEDFGHGYVFRIGSRGTPLPVTPAQAGAHGYGAHHGRTARIHGFRLSPE